MVGTEPPLVRDGAEHPPRTPPAPAPQRRASSRSGDPSRSGGGSVRPAAPRPPTSPSRSRCPHLPPGRRSPASLPGGAPRGIPTFRNRPGDDLLGLIKYAKRFPLRYPRPGLRGPTPAPADSAGRPQGNLPPASPFPPASGPAACLSFPVCEAGAAPRSPGERRRSCQRCRPASPWARNKGTLEPPAAGSPRRPPPAVGRERGAPAPRPWGPPRAAALLGEAKPHPEPRRGALHPRGRSLRGPRWRVTWLCPRGAPRG